MKFMLKNILFLFLFLFFVCSISKLEAQENYEIRKIKIKGNKAFGKSDILDVTAMHETNFIQRRIQKKDPSIYTKDFIEHDILRIINFYQGEGFIHANAKEDSVVIKNEKKKRVDVYISIIENNPVKVDSVRLNMREPYPEVDKDSLIKKTRRNLELKRGKRFVDKTLYSDVQRINTTMMNLGYVYAKTDFDLDLKYEADLTNITYYTDAGIRCNFGETTITGNKRIKDKIIEKQLTYKAGDQFCQDELDKTRRHLYSLQLFRIVSIVPMKDKATQRNPIPVEIKIEEMSRWMTKFGLGWGTEDKFRAFADITYRGLFGGSSRVNLFAKHSALTPYYVSLSWIQPQFYIKNFSVSVNPYIERENEPGYNTQTIGLKLPLAYPIGKYIQTSLSYYFEKVTQHVESDDADIPNPEDDKFLYNKSGIAASFSFNNSDPVYAAESGWLVNVGGKINGYIFGTDFNYTKLYFDIRKYYRFRKIVVSGRYMMGGIHSSDESGFIPVEDRFYSGGSNSNRGWARAQLGPKRESGSPLGGKSIIEMNIEIRRHLFWRIEIAAFMDFGNVWEQAYHYDFNNLAYAAGGGLRISTPIGPVRLDVGVPLWNEKKSVQFYISIGQAF